MTQKLSKEKKAEKAFTNLKTIVDRHTQRQVALRRPETEAEAEKDVKEIHVALNELIKIQDSMTSGDFLAQAANVTTLQRRSNFTKFAVWIQKNSVDSQIGQTWYPDPTVVEGAGIVAARDIEAEELIMSIPRNLMMSYETALASPFGLVIARDALLTNQKSLALSLHLLFERLNPESFWTPYMDTLPTDFTSPFSATLDELEPLRGSAEFYSILTTFKALIRQYCHATSIFKGQVKALGLPSFTYKQFRWACLTIMARQNKIVAKTSAPANANSSQPSTILALIPGFDCFNHVDIGGELTTYYDVTKDCSDTLAPRNVKKGQQIYILYGERPNSKLFTYQGFVVSDLSTDKVRVPLVYMPEPTTSAERDLNKLRESLVLKAGLFHPELQVPYKEGNYSEYDFMPPPFAPLTTWRDAWKALFVRVMTKEEVTEALSNVPEVFKMLGARFLGEAHQRLAMEKEAGQTEVANIAGILFQEDCPDAIKPRVMVHLRFLLEKALKAYSSDAETHQDSDSAITSLCRDLVKEEKKVLNRMLKSLN